MWQEQSLGGITCTTSDAHVALSAVVPEEGRAVSELVVNHTAEGSITVRRSHLDCTVGMGVCCRPADPAVPHVPCESGTSAGEGMGADHVSEALVGVVLALASARVGAFEEDLNSALRRGIVQEVDSIAFPSFTKRGESGGRDEVASLALTRVPFLTHQGAAGVRHQTSWVSPFPVYGAWEMVL